MKTTHPAALVALLLMRSYEMTADPASQHKSASVGPSRIVPSPATSIEHREEPAEAGTFQPHAAKTHAPSREAGNLTTVPSTADDKSSYDADAYRLCALLEGWPGRDAAETQRFLAESFVEPLRRHFPGITQGELTRLAGEFETKIFQAFQNLAATVSREHFTHAELRQLIQFFETPLGRKSARSYPAWKDRIAAGDGERQKVVSALFDRARDLVGRDER